MEADNSQEQLGNNTGQDLQDLYEDVQKNKENVNEGEKDEERIDRIESNLKISFDALKGSDIVSRDNFIQRCRHETGNFYTGENLSPRRKRIAQIICDQYPGGIMLQIDRNSGNVPLAYPLKPARILTRNGQEIYGGYNYLNIGSNSKHIPEDKKHSTMNSKDVNGLGETVDVQLHVFESDQDFVDTILHKRIQAAGVGPSDDLMTMMAKISATQGFNGFGNDYVAKYANSGFLRQARYLDDQKQYKDIRLAIPTQMSLQDVVRITKSQLSDSFMEELYKIRPDLHRQYTKLFQMDKEQLDAKEQEKTVLCDDLPIKDFGGNKTNTYSIVTLDLSSDTKQQR